MKHRIITAVIIAAIAACLLCGAASAMTGSGTQSNPYIISSQADLALLSGSNYASYAGNNKYFELGADITMSGTFTPIGSNSYKFNGHFDGKGHKITGLTVNADYAGLFSYITSMAEIKNIDFYNAKISGAYPAVLVSNMVGTSSKAVITNINVYNSVVTTTSRGGAGIVSLVSGGYIDIVSCSVFSSLINGGSCWTNGGVVGHGASGGSHSVVDSCVVKDCIITSSSISVGGICGEGPFSNSDMVIRSCTVENCYLGTSNSHIGGIIGHATFEGGTTCTIENCYVIKTTIRGKSFVGGIYGSYRKSGSTPANVIGCSVTDSVVFGGSYAGGITGGYSSS